MLRVPKQILYGLFFLVIFASIAWVSFQPQSVKEVATCTDGIQNQNEEGVDCGGSCADCELKDLTLDVGGVNIIKVEDKSSLLVKVTNPSQDFGATEVPYQFEVTNKSGGSLETVEGNLNIGGGEEKYIGVAGLNINVSDIGEVVFYLDDFEFTPKEDLLNYDFQINQPETTFPNNVVQVKGLLENKSSLVVQEVSLTAIFYTESGDPANMGTIFISDVKAFETRDFLISVPRNDFFIDPDRTEISWRVI